MTKEIYHERYKQLFNTNVRDQHPIALLDSKEEKEQVKLKDSSSPEIIAYVLFKELLIHSLYIAARMGALDLIELVYNMFPEEFQIWSAFDVGTVGFNGRIRRKQQRHLMDLAAEYGQLDILKTLRLSSDSSILVACCGDLEMLKLLFKERPDQVDLNMLIDSVTEIFIIYVH
ncbi:hypothetical protein PPL_06713 [Heterostelium album PN500]|uniref:Ankyrin repeat protein n=1 Tax=Heterostelium pallidum (strain ATCC 26659 / Pp 5 / PN500) TaxID=670386 RepID=D3BFH9_HETP5|nr:hypothetical protein PPL_06713 [Heterostelium album PN500]EFA79893.1 hypothetical protein PPL_06713 [Heterostelium album PN500]|eukprot:XP_020432014.1 hypothetical protein PPL_06713 [Heterostelium album PN500]